MEGTVDNSSNKNDDERRNLPPPSSSSTKRLDVTWKANPSSKKAKFDSNSNFQSGNFFESSHKGKEKPLTDYIYSIQTGGKIESSIVVEEVGPLVIPLVGKQHDDEEDEENETSEEKPSTKQKKGPLLSRHLSKDLINCKTDDDRFKLDIQSRPTDLHAKSTSYDNIPVESFGAALLRGMGWDGRTHAEMMKKKDGDKLNNRPFRLGLGADPKDLIDAAKGGNNNNQKSSSSNSATNSKQEIERRRLKEQEKLKQQQLQRLPGMFLIGDFVFSNEIDRRGKVLQTQGVPGLSKIRIQVEHTGDITDVSKSSLKLLDNLEIKLNPIVFPEQNINESKTNETTSTPTTQFFGLKNNPDELQKAVKTGLADSDGNNPLFPGFTTSTATNTTTTSEKTKPMTQSEKKPDRPSWIRSGIRVKMVGKMKDTDNNISKYYLQKGTILDVVSKGLAHVRFDNGGMEDVKEKYLETVLPLKGEKGMVLLGMNKGEVGTLLERDNQKESVVIQLSESLEVMEIDMDSIAAFRGDHMH
jgi:hypothetical protein